MVRRFYLQLKRFRSNGHFKFDPGDRMHNTFCNDLPRIFSLSLITDMIVLHRDRE